MIKIELQFTSVAEAAAFFAGRAAPAVTTATVSADPKPEKAATPPKPRAEKPASPPAAADSSPPATGAASSASSTEASQSAGAAETIPYSDLQKAVFAVAALGAGAKTAVLALAAQLGAPTFKELPAAKWAEAKALVEALHAELAAEVA